MALFLSGTVADAFMVWPLDGPKLTIGRSTKSSIQINHRVVSKEHAEVTRRGDRLYIRDLGSHNGTRVNGVSATDATELSLGDIVEIGNLHLRVTREEPTQMVRFSDATVVGSSVMISADQLIKRQVKLGSADPGAIVQLLAEAGRLLVLPRPLEETCDEILKFVERAIPASRYVLLLQSTPDAEPEQLAARTEGSGSNQPLALSRSIVNQVVKENKSVLTTDAKSDPRFQGQHSIVVQQVLSAMAVPLFDNERVLGILYVDSRKSQSPFNQADLEVLTLLANMVAVKITNARLLEAEQAQARLAQELATAARIQQRLLPVGSPQVDGYEIDSYLETCHEMGGDLYDFRITPDGRVLFMIGDVSGKGMGAALLMSSFLSSARVLYDVHDNPLELARRLNDVAFEQTGAARFITGIVGYLEPATGKIQYVNAGHPPVCIVGGGEVRVFPCMGVPFGILDDYAYEMESRELKPGEMLALFSDGIPEAQLGKEFFDDERFYKSLVEAGGEAKIVQVREKIIATVDDFLDGEPRTDDITLVMIRRRS